MVWFGEIGEEIFGSIKNHGAEGDLDDEVGAVFAMFGLGLSWVAGFGFPVFGGAEIGEGVFVGIGFENDVAAFAAVTAKRAAFGCEFFFAPGDDAVSAGAGLDFDLGGVLEMHLFGSRFLSGDGDWSLFAGLSHWVVFGEFFSQGSGFALAKFDWKSADAVGANVICVHNCDWVI